MGSEEVERVRRFGSLAEAPGDHSLFQTLFDRATEDAIEWSRGQIDSIRQWFTELTWRTPPDSVPGFKFGRFDGRPRGGDAYPTQKFLAQLAQADCELVLIHRDADGDVGREASVREGVRAFRETFHGRLTVCIGVPSLESEAWVLSGFEPRDAREAKLLSDLTAELGFDPTLTPERLTDRLHHQPKSPKRVLSILTQRDAVREGDCCAEAPLTTLRARGTGNGLATFLAEAGATAKKVFEG